MSRAACAGTFLRPCSHPSLVIAGLGLDTVTAQLCSPAQALSRSSQHMSASLPGLASSPP